MFGGQLDSTNDRGEVIIIGKIGNLRKRVVAACDAMGAEPKRYLSESYSLFWVEKGKGKCLLAIHGFSSCFYTWRYLFQESSPALRIVAIDLPGFGFSGELSRDEDVLEFYCEVLSDFIIEREQHPVAICGHSYGAIVAWELAARSPRLISKVILVSPPVPGARTCFNEKSSVMLNAYSDRSSIDQAVFDIYRAARVRTPLCLQRMAHFPNVKIGSSRELPSTLGLWGRRDRIVDPVQAMSWWCHNTKAQVCFINDAGHCPHEERPVAVMRLMNDFCLDERVKK